MAAEGIKADSFLLLNVPDEVLIQRVVGRRLDPDTGDIYHLDFSPPPAEIVHRFVLKRAPFPFQSKRSDHSRPLLPLLLLHSVCC